MSTDGKSSDKKLDSENGPQDPKRNRVLLWGALSVVCSAAALMFRNSNNFRVRVDAGFMLGASDLHVCLFLSG